jgi:hypothetical protein
MNDIRESFLAAHKAINNQRSTQLSLKDELLNSDLELKLLDIALEEERLYFARTGSSPLTLQYASPLVGICTDPIGFENADYATPKNSAHKPFQDVPLSPQDANPPTQKLDFSNHRRLSLGEPAIHSTGHKNVSMFEFSSNSSEDATLALLEEGKLFAPMPANRMSLLEKGNLYDSTCSPFTSDEEECQPDFSGGRESEPDRCSELSYRCNLGKHDPRLSLGVQFDFEENFPPDAVHRSVKVT